MSTKTMVENCPQSTLEEGRRPTWQPVQCRNRIETVLASDIRVKSAKARMLERSARMAMKEEYPTKLAGLSKLCTGTSTMRTARKTVVT